MRWLIPQPCMGARVSVLRTRRSRVPRRTSAAFGGGVGMRGEWRVASGDRFSRNSTEVREAPVGSQEERSVPSALYSLLSTLYSLQLSDVRAPALDLGPIARIVVAGREEPLRVLRQTRIRQVRGEEVGAGVRAHDAVPRERAEHICAVDGKGADERAILA